MQNIIIVTTTLFTAAEMFAKSLRRQTTLVQLAKVGLIYSMNNSTEYFCIACSDLLLLFCLCSQCHFAFSILQGARGVLRSSESVGYILNDWRSIDFEAASSQIAFTHQLPEQSLELFKECKHWKIDCHNFSHSISLRISVYTIFIACSLAVAGEFEQLLVKQSSLEIYFEWLDSLIEHRVCEVSSTWVTTSAWCMDS